MLAAGAATVVGDTMSVSLEGQANSLALNKEYNHVVVAGRNVFKLFRIEDSEFVEHCNLRVGKNLNLNFSCNHVAWNNIDHHILATAATNGAVVVWNLNRPTRSKQEHVFNEHKRTVNKVCFHPVESNLLLSGSQDGTMKCFDLRIKDVVKTFVSNSESVRDVQFSPHSGQNTFAAVAENGTVQLWDRRRCDRYYQQFTAHSGPIFACEWHPECQWLATASRDKSIKIWDLNIKPTLEFTIHTIASIGHIAWRPNRRFHIASCALVVDCSINVWDIRRPYIPFASFDKHKDFVTGVAWRGTPYLFVSASRDCTLMQHAFRDAGRPAASGNPQGIAVRWGGEIAWASRVDSSQIESVNSLYRPRKQPSVTTPATFYQSNSSALRIFPPLKYTKDSGEDFRACAERYLLTGRSFTELCEHNATVARSLAMEQVATAWQILRAVYGFGSGEDREGGEDSNNGKVPSSRDPSELGDKSNPRNLDSSLLSTLDDPGDPAEPEEPTTVQVDVPQLTLPQIPFTPSLGDFFFGDGEMDPLGGPSGGEDMGTGVGGAGEWMLQQEAFIIRHEILEGDVVGERLDAPGSSAAPPVPAAHVEPLQKVQLIIHAYPTACPINANDLVKKTLFHHLNLGDIQTTVAMLFVMGERRRDLDIDLNTQELWLLNYIDLLGRCRLFNVAAEVIQQAWLPSVSELSQQSTTIYTCCGECSKPLQRSGWLCDRCHSAKTSVCAVCHQVVRGLYTWCQGCGHGGHLGHMTKWFRHNKECPRGCGHQCEYT